MTISICEDSIIIHIVLRYGYLNNEVVYIILYNIAHYVSYVILCLYAGAMSHYNKDSTTYWVHDYLARRFHAWYAKFKPSSSAVVSAGDPELGAVVPVEGMEGAAPPAKKPRFSLRLNDISAAPAAAGPTPPSTTEEGGEDTADKERSGQSSPHS